MRCLRLPWHFDPARLRHDLDAVRPEEWIAHVNRRHYEGQWSGAPLRSLAGATDNLVPDAHGGTEFRDTPLLRRCPYFRDVLATFRCPLQSVRLLRLHAGSSIAEHIDHALDFDDGEVRLHIPIVTHDEVRFFLDGARLVMAPGECWYTNVNLPHSVDNSSPIDRIHLVLDCRVDHWLRQVFDAATPPAPDYYAARFSGLAAPAPARMLSFAARFAASRSPSARFSIDRNTLIVQWPGPPAWQLRLHTDSADEAWSARLESSPDPAGSHRADVEAWLAGFAAEFPDTAIRREGSP